MHPLGKVLLVFAIIGSGCAIYFSGKLLDQKQAWMKKAEDREKELAEITAKNRANQLLKETREAELNRLLLGWDRYWNDIPLNVALLENAPPTITVGVGTDKRLQEKQRLAIFATPGASAPKSEAAPADGAAPPAGGAAPVTVPAEGAAKPAATGSRYLGMFTINAVGAERSALAPDGRPTPQQIESLTSGKVRVRTLIPAELEQPFTALQKNVLTMDERIAETQAELKSQQLRLEAAQAEQTAREKEIEGNSALKGRTLPPEVIEGLIATMAVEEEQRNSALESVKSLQTRLKDTVERIAALRGEIEQLVRSLPQPGSPQASRELSPR